MSKNNNIFNIIKETIRQTHTINKEKIYSIDSHINIYKKGRIMKSNSLSKRNNTNNFLLKNNISEKFRTAMKEINIEKNFKSKDFKNNIKLLFKEKLDNQYCLNCQKIINNEEEKTLHKNCSLIPIKENYTKSEVFNLIKVNEGKRMLLDKGIKFEIVNTLKLTILKINKPENEIQYVDSLEIWQKKKKKNKKNLKM